MYEFQGWFNLAESTYESDDGSLDDKVQMLKRTIEERFIWPNVRVELFALNGKYTVTVAGYVNRSRDETIAVQDLLELIATKLPGSWGILYQRDTDIAEGESANSYQVSVMARGRIEQREDPFLSPCNPVFED